MPFEIVRNDITKMSVDAIVNPTNPRMYGTAGVDGMIHRLEGPRLLEEIHSFGSLGPGECALTKALRLPADHIILTIGTVWEGGNNGEMDVLKNCYRNALELAKNRGFKSIAFPLMASGANGWPEEVALSVAIGTIGEFLLFNEMSVYLVVFGKKAFRLSKALYSSVAAYIDDHYIEEISSAEIFESPVGRVYEYRASMESERLDLKDIVNHLDETFSEMLLRLIDERGLRDPEVYKKANVTKQTFSKIRNNKEYMPTKQTAVAFAIALKLNLDETKDLLMKSGYALSSSHRFDVIISYFLESGNYDINEINAVLFNYEEKLLGI